MAFFGDLISNIAGLFWEQININGYVFDAYLRMNTRSSTTITQNPVENGSTISDHAYDNPTIFTFDIGMTDTAQGKVFGQFGFLDRSVNAYRLLDKWKKDKTLLTVNGKYGFYENVLIQDINTDDTYLTSNGLRAVVTLQQLNITSTQLVKVSSASFYTSSTNRGLQNATSPSRNVSSLVSSGLLEGS